MQPVVGLGVHGLHDRTGRVDADQVEQGERAHGQTAAEPHRRVDVLAGGVLRLVHRGGLVEVAEQQPVGDESGAVADRDGLLAELDRQIGDRGDGLRCGQHRRDHLDQLHRRGRVEEVQTQDALGTRGVGGETGDGEGVGAGREDRLRADDVVEGAEDLVLDLVRLRRHLDDQVGVGRLAQIGGGAETGEEVLALLFGEASAHHGTGGRGLQDGDGLRGRGLADVDADDLAAGAVRTSVMPVPIVPRPITATVLSGDREGSGRGVAIAGLQK